MKLTNPDSNLKAIGCMIFAGSATLGTMKSGYHIDRVLEISDDIINQNAYHFIKNYPDVPVIIPSEWENPQYLGGLKEEKFDLLYANCPCSGLSQINRNSSADNKTNDHFYRVFNAISEIQPKAFIIENAPTLIKLGYPILKELTHVLGSKYRFTIVRDQAANHNTPMKRMRTMIVGWNREYFNQIPLLHMDKQPLFSVKDAIGDLYETPLNKETNHVCIEKREWGQYEHLNHLIPEGKTSLMAFIDQWDDIKDEFAEKDRAYIERSAKRISNGEGIWNKSPYKSFENGHSPSMTSLSKVIHPVLNRQYTIREYARMMGFPDSFIFYPDECPTPIVQCIAQGVPVNFFQYITTEIKEALAGNRTLIEDSEDKIINFEHHIKMKYQSFIQSEIDEMTFLDVDKTALVIPE